MLELVYANKFHSQIAEKKAEKKPSINLGTLYKQKLV
jgi:hypothetical protein